MRTPHGRRGTHRRGDGAAWVAAAPPIAVSVVTARVAAALVVVAVAVGCAPGPSRTLSIGDLTTAARRVEGGGAECPLRVDREILRPASIGPESIIAPLRIDGVASLGTIGESRPDSDLGRRRGVQVDCWFRIRNLRVDVAVTAVREGESLAQLAKRLEQHSRSTPAEIQTFLAAHLDLAAGDAAAVPGDGDVAFAKVASSDADVGLLVAYTSIEGKGTPPDADELSRIAAELAVALAD